MEDAKYVYLVLECLEGGELFDRITKKGKYGEEDARQVRIRFFSLQDCLSFQSNQPFYSFYFILFSLYTFSGDGTPRYWNLQIASTWHLSPRP